MTKLYLQKTKSNAYGINELLDSPIDFSFELTPVYSSQKSFYNKANVFVLENGTKVLQSYSTIVAAVLPDGRFISNGVYSATTRNHEYEFMNQFSHDNGSLTDYVLGQRFILSEYF